MKKIVFVAALLAAMFVGTAPGWAGIEQGVVLVGPKGDQGSAGARGSMGPQGYQGARGNRGLRGAPGRTVIQRQYLSKAQVRAVLNSVQSGPARTNSERWSVDESLNRGLIAGRRYKPSLDDPEWQSPTKRWETAEALRRHDSSYRAHPEAFARHDADSKAHPYLLGGIDEAQKSANRAWDRANWAFWIAVILLSLLLLWLLVSLIEWLLCGRVGPFWWRPAPIWGVAAGGGAGGGGAVIGPATPPVVWTP